MLWCDGTTTIDGGGAISGLYLPDEITQPYHAPLLVLCNNLGYLEVNMMESLISPSSVGEVRVSLWIIKFSQLYASKDKERFWLDKKT